MYLQCKNITNKLQLQERIFYNIDKMRVFEGNRSLLLKSIHFSFDKKLNISNITYSILSGYNRIFLIEIYFWLFDQFE